MSGEFSAVRDIPVHTQMLEVARRKAAKCFTAAFIARGETLIQYRQCNPEQSSGTQITLHTLYHMDTLVSCSSYHMCRCLCISRPVIDGTSGSQTRLQSSQSNAVKHRLQCLIPLSMHFPLMLLTASCILTVCAHSYMQDADGVCAFVAGCLCK